MLERAILLVGVTALAGLIYLMGFVSGRINMANQINNWADEALDKIRDRKEKMSSE